MINFFVGLPWSVLALIIVVAFSVVGVVGMSLTQRFVLPRLGRVDHQNEVTGTVLHGILIVYGLAVALIAIAVWEKYVEVSKIVGLEAAAIAATYRDASGYPEPTRTRLQLDLKNYTEHVINVCWPQQRRGKVPASGVEMLDEFQDGLFAFEPTTNGQIALHQETLRGYNALIQARRLRLESVSSGLPAPMWAVVLLGALITLISAFFFDVANLTLHRFMIVLLSGIMGLLIFLIAFYDRPYRGSNALTPEPYVLVHHHLMEH